METCLGSFTKNDVICRNVDFTCRLSQAPVKKNAIRKTHASSPHPLHLHLLSSLPLPSPSPTTLLRPLPPNHFTQTPPAPQTQWKLPMQSIPEGRGMAPHQLATLRCDDECMSIRKLVSDQ